MNHHAKRVRIIPTDMMPTPVQETASDKPEAQTAKMINTEEGFCPVCRMPLLASTANGHQVAYCPDHSLVMPVRDTV